jgi:tRNA (cytidine/uridine-2'-O-)-methyltransferase
MLDIVLVEPEIPQNTGAIARLCAATGCRLQLVGPLGFSLDDRNLKRAGLDYWRNLNVGLHRDLETCLSTLGDRPFYLLSRKACRRYTDIPFTPDDVLVFGKESVGLPEPLLARHPDRGFRLPIRTTCVRSLNLAGAVHAVVYAALARLEFPGIEE